MTNYRGDRTLDGVEAWADDQRLDPRTDIKTLSKNGFEWGYEGPEPDQLALALLAHHLGDPAKALAHHDAFMRQIVANFGNEWEMTSADMDEALKSILG